MADKCKIFIDREEFKAAVKKAVDETMSEAPDGMGKLVIPMTGVIFSKKIEKILFGEEVHESEVTIHE